jgi:hypothetical protein
MVLIAIFFSISMLELLNLALTWLNWQNGQPAN